MSTLVEEFKKYQKQERVLTISLVVLAISSPFIFEGLLVQKLSWQVVSLIVVIFMGSVFSLYCIRRRITQRLSQAYTNLNVGAILAKKISPQMPRHFVITNLLSDRYHLKCLKTGEQVLVCKDRVREDFDIAN